MGLAIKVKRGAGDKQGQDIVDPLVTTVQVAIDRGRAELDSSAENLQTVQLTVKFRPGIRNGQLIEVHDELQGESWRGKIIGIQYANQGLKLTAQLTVVRPR